MPKTRKPYPPEFREQMVAPVRAGRSPEELSREFEPSAACCVRLDMDGHYRPSCGMRCVPTATQTFFVSM
jgi:hypothetical protein